MTRILLSLFLVIVFAAPSAQAQSSYGTAKPHHGTRNAGDLARFLAAMELDVGGCNIDPDMYNLALDKCREEGGPPRQCQTYALRAACVPQVTTPPEPSSGNRFTDLVARGGMKVFDPERIGQTEGCSGPKPDDIGCTTICKPCITFICSDGEWQAERIDFPDELCKPIGGGGPSATACPRGPTGFCPAECSMCF